MAAGFALTRFLKRCAADQNGATAIEYAVLIAFLGTTIVAALSVFQDSLYGIINSAVQALGGA